MNNKLPSNFSDIVMASINTEIVRREKVEERIMYCTIIGVCAILCSVLIYIAHHFNWFIKIKEIFRSLNISHSFENTANSFSPIWIIIFINSLILIGVFSYFTNKKEKEFTPPL